MDLGIKDQVAIVAAASRGLGKAAAFALASEGAKVSICSRTWWERHSNALGKSTS